MPIVAVVVVPIHIVRIEVEVVGVVRIVRIERTRPIVAVRPCVVQITIVAIASSRKTKHTTTPKTTSVFLFYGFGDSVVFETKGMLLSSTSKPIVPSLLSFA